MKKCNVCGKEKSLDNFFFIRYNKKNGSPLYRAKCDDCYNEHYREKHRSKSEKERKKIYHQRKSKTTFETRKNYRLMIRFGITLDEYHKMCHDQKNCCYICKKSFGKSFLDKANIDHNHSTGKIRKLLCTRCNTTLGLLEENPDILHSCISYLKEHNDHIRSDKMA